MNMRGFKSAGIVLGVTALILAVVFGLIFLGQVLFPGAVGGIGATALIFAAMFFYIAWADSK